VSPPPPTPVLTEYGLYSANTMESDTQESQCTGSIPVSTRVDRGMVSVLDTAAEREGVCRSEAVRLVLDVLEASERGGLECPDCGEKLELL